MNGVNRVQGSTRNRKRFLEHWQALSLLLMLYDTAAVFVAYFFALWSRFDFTFSKIPESYLNAYKRFLPFYAAGCLVLFWFFRLYKSIWRFAS